MIVYPLYSAIEVVVNGESDWLLPTFIGKGHYTFGDAPEGQFDHGMQGPETTKPRIRSRFCVVRAVCVVLDRLL